MAQKPNPNLSDRPAMHVPAGRSLSDVPKGEPKPIPANTPKGPNTRLTLRQMLTQQESKEYLVGFLKELGTKRKTGPWRSYLEFYTLNHTGDVDSMKPETKKYCEKMIEDINSEFFDAQQL